MLDRTLRDAGRTKRVTGYKVVGAVPSLSASRYGGLTKTYVQHSASELTNSLLRFLDKRNLRVYSSSICSVSMKIPMKKQ